MKMTTNVVVAVVAAVYKESGGKTVHAAYVKKALAQYQLISSCKGPDYCPRTNFNAGMTPESTLPPKARTSNSNKGMKTSRYLPY